jgi:DNA-binding beta-propeller fold protein YncE
VPYLTEVYLKRLLLVACLFATTLCCAQVTSSGTTVSTIAGKGTPGYSNQQVNNPYGLVIGPDGRLYFCDLDNQRIRRLDLKTRLLTTIAGNGRRGYTGDGGPAIEASMNMPHELRFDKMKNIYVAERDNHIVRKIDDKTHIISTVAGTGVAGFSGDGGPATKAQLRQPHSIAFDPQGRLLICDLGNHRIRRVNLMTGIIETYAGTGERKPTPDGSPVAGTPLNGPRTMALDPQGNIYLALREGNAILRIDPKTRTIHHIAGTGEKGYAGDGGPARAAKLSGPKGLAYAPDGSLYVADTENHAIRRIDLKTGVISTVLGTGERGDGPEADPMKCKLSRPHGVFVDSKRTAYVADSEAHRIRVLHLGGVPFSAR